MSAILSSQSEFLCLPSGSLQGRLRSRSVQGAGSARPPEILQLKNLVLVLDGIVP